MSRVLWHNSYSHIMPLMPQEDVCHHLQKLSAATGGWKSYLVVYVLFRLSILSRTVSHCVISSSLDQHEIEERGPQQVCWPSLFVVIEVTLSCILLSVFIWLTVMCGTWSIWLDGPELFLCLCTLCICPCLFDPLSPHSTSNGFILANISCSCKIPTKHGKLALLQRWGWAVDNIRDSQWYF